MSTLHLTILKTFGDPLTLEMKETDLYRALTQVIGRQIDTDAGKIMLYGPSGELVNGYPFLPLNYYLQDNDTLQLLITDYIHPTYIPKPFIKDYPPPLYRLNNAYENQHPNDIPDLLKDDANTYFINKKTKRDQFYNQSPIGQQYLEKLRQSLDYWEITHI